MPQRRCGCGRMVTGACEFCTKQRRQHVDRFRREDAHRAALRTERWRRYSLRWLAEHPFCGTRADNQRYPQHSRCTRLNLLTLAECTDHIVPISKGGSVFRPDNHQSLCFACNSAKGDRLDVQDDTASRRGDDDALVFA
jgi:5-methylcytosine-specific restriction endonuclease McrA